MAIKSFTIRDLERSKSAKDQLLRFKSVLDVELKKYLDKSIKEAYEISPYAGEMTEYITDLTMRGGKRIRAALLFYSYLAHGGTDKKEALKASMAMELSETYLLIHDDIMDNDRLRRGGETIHESYEQKIKAKHLRVTNGSHHFGESMAMLAGDIACAMSNEILSGCNFDKEYLNNVIAELNEIYRVECYGQALDMFSQTRDDLTADDVILTHKLKTVPYTFDGPVKIGAILAGLSPKNSKKLEGYTIPLGVAFQVQDDILGLFGSIEKLGKPVTSDLREGKKTLLMLDALARADQNGRDIINQNLGNCRATIKGLKEVREVVKSTGALEESMNLARNLAQEAAEFIKKHKLNEEGSEFMLNLANYVVNREY